MADDEVLELYVHVSPRAAILAGKTVTGKRKVRIYAQDLNRLSVELREELAAAYETQVILGTEADPPIDEPTFTAVIPVLEARAKARVAATAAARVVEARQTEEAAVTSRAVTARDNARAKALRAWVEKNGDDEQKARMAEGFLPEEEILDAVAEDLLDLRGLDLYTPLFKGDVCDCHCAGSVYFEQHIPPRNVDAFQFARLQAIREAVPTGASVELVEHRGACPSCKCVPLARISAKVCLPWEGWALVREFSLK